MCKHVNTNFIRGNYPEIDAIAKDLAKRILVDTSAVTLLDAAVNYQYPITRVASRDGLFRHYPELRKEWARRFLSGPFAESRCERALAMEELARVPVYPFQLRSVR